MTIRKFFFIAIVFLSGSILGRPLFFESLGVFIKIFAYLDKGWSFHYDSVDWYKGQLIFSSVKIKEKNCFSLKSPQMSVNLSRKHLELEAPHLFISSLPQSSSQQNDWTLSMKGGVLEGPELEKTEFSFEKILPNQVGRLCFQWDSADLVLEGMRQGKEVCFQAELKDFEAPLLLKNTLYKGIINGNIHLVFEESQWNRGSAHLNIENGGYSDLFSVLDGTIDWEGDAFDLSLISLMNWKEIIDTKEERLRLVIANGTVKGSLGNIQGVTGDLSFLSGLGAKWEFKGESILPSKSALPLLCEGRAFLHTQKPHWIESEFQCANSSFSMKGNEEKEGIFWDIACNNLGSIEASFLHPFLISYSSIGPQWKFLDGYLHGWSKIFTVQNSVQHWDLACLVENFSFQGPSFIIDCKEGNATFSSKEKNGAFSFEGTNFTSSVLSPKNIEGEKWSGKGTVKDGLLIESSIQGVCEKIDTAFQAKGSLDLFHIDAQIEKGVCSLTGTLKEQSVAFQIEKGEIDSFAFSGKGEIDSDFSFCLHLDQFKGPLSVLSQRLGWSYSLDGLVSSTGFGMQINGSPEFVDGSVQMKGEWISSPDHVFPFYFPILEKKGELFTFDMRLQGPTWDWVRLYGFSAGEGAFSFDPTRSHILGQPALISSCQWNGSGIEKVSVELELQTKALFLASSLLKKDIGLLASLPISGNSSVSLNYEREGTSSIQMKGKDLCWKEEAIDFDFLAKGNQENWELLNCQLQDVSITGKIKKEKDIFRFYQGVIDWEDAGVGSHFRGNLSIPSFQAEFHLSNLHLDLASLHPIMDSIEMPLQGLNGSLKGTGCITWKGFLEADFDCITSDLKVQNFEWENRTPLHLYYSSIEGLSFSGIDCYSARYEGVDLPDLNCKMDLLMYDPMRSLWFFNGAHLYLPSNFLQKIPQIGSYLKRINFEENLDFFVDCCTTSDFSKITCCMKEGFIPFGDTVHHLQNLTFFFSSQEFWAQCCYPHQGHLLNLHLDVNLDPTISGRLTFESAEYPLEEDELPLSIYWMDHLEKGFCVKEITGTFAGLEACFYAAGEDPHLIGSARLNCSTFSQIVPPEIAQLFTDLEMGKGYELKGRLILGQGYPSFSGILSGKQFGLFGYQLRTLLAGIELSTEEVRVFDLKISDSAAILKTDEIIAKSEQGQPWTISIPQLTILELRPSLLQTAGGEPGTISPLIVRELCIRDFKGLIDDSKTYTAEGELSFINSYRREYTLLDIPADLLSRIVGLDLSLLIPACGELSYELKNGYVFLKELKGSYSEGKRSEFFLVPTDPVPKMDLKGNLEILVKCNQFVLFKFMESFMISIEGSLNDPKFHLQKKRRFWGL